MIQLVPSEQAYSSVAWLLRCEEAAVRAVAHVESGSEGAFLEDQQPVILFERHLFRRFTHGKFDDQRFNNESWGILSDREPGGYGPLTAQHAKLAAAVLLDRDAALRACSWGLFQILGDNHSACGYPDLQRFINAMYRSADDHVRAFAMFIRNDYRLVDAIRNKNWKLFAKVYNGPGNVDAYSKKLREAYYALNHR